ncbi:hypothetical protein Tco_1042713 [Tanacetum coccineum]|uniref:Uncharacterized protein n=1 Tax=Tanacetum coccineum TaxID=301880 RepID=A0ABQ5GJX0_9ASTR
MYSPFGKMWYLADKDAFEEEYEQESKVFDLLKISDDLFTYDTPLGMVFDEFRRLGSIENDLFTYELGVVKDFYFPCAEQQCDNLKMVILMFMSLEGDDEEIETNIFEFETPLCKEFKEFNHLLQIDADVLTGDLTGFKTYEDYKNAWIYEWNKEVLWVEEKPCYNSNEDGYCNGENLPEMIQVGNMTYFQDYEWYEGLEDGDFKNEALKEKSILEGSWGHENKEGKNFCSWLKECSSNYQDLDYELMRKLEELDQEQFDNHEPLEDDDDIMGLDDYLIRQNASYYVDEEE